MSIIRAPFYEKPYLQRRRGSSGAPKEALGALGGVFDSIGVATTKVTDPSAFLVAQVNRFTGPGVPQGHSVGDQPFPGSEITPGVALAALIIATRRAQQAVEQFGDPGSKALLAGVKAVLGQGSANPDATNVAFATGNAPALGSEIKIFGDMLGLAPAKAVGGGPSNVIKGAAVVGVLAGAIFWFTRGRR